MDHDDKSIWMDESCQHHPDLMNELADMKNYSGEHDSAEDNSRELDSEDHDIQSAAAVCIQNGNDAETISNTFTTFYHRTTAHGIPNWLMSKGSFHSSLTHHCLINYCRCLEHVVS